MPTVTVEAACSKHRRKDVLPIHPELVELLPAWMNGLAPDELLFPRIARKKTWLMVKKDLERVGIPYETPEGIADFHACRPALLHHGSPRNGASIIEARELARHADVRMTMKYTHIGLEDQARTPWPALPAPDGVSAALIGSAIGRVSGGSRVGALTRTALATTRTARKTTKPLPGKGFRRRLSLTFRKLSVDVSSGGGGNCTRVPRSFGDGLYVRSRSFVCRPRGPDRQGPCSAYPVMNLTQAATGG